MVGRKGNDGVALPLNIWGLDASGHAYSKQITLCTRIS